MAPSALQEAVLGEVLHGLADQCEDAGDVGLGAMLRVGEHPISLEIVVQDVDDRAKRSIDNLLGLQVHLQLPHDEGQPRQRGGEPKAVLHELPLPVELAYYLRRPVQGPALVPERVPPRRADQRRAAQGLHEVLGDVRVRPRFGAQALQNLAHGQIEVGHLARARVHHERQDHRADRRRALPAALDGGRRPVHLRLQRQQVPEQPRQKSHLVPVRRGLAGERRDGLEAAPDDRLERRRLGHGLHDHLQAGELPERDHGPLLRRRAEAAEGDPLQHLGRAAVLEEGPGLFDDAAVAQIGQGRDRAGADPRQLLRAIA
mmetsp:Transcript_78655/g.240702  ORF Transcript_78655/g.240702 Transcript_78655/m.240702 type:complete len:316 (+) Transcript_78655:382-1329(+)